MHIHTSLFLISVLSSLFFTGSVSHNGDTDAPSTSNPLSPKSYLLRYWDRQITNRRSRPLFLISKASPMSPVDSAILQKLVDQKALASNIQTFCSSARLFCFPESNPSLAKHDKDSNFAVYSNSNFTNYGTTRIGGTDSFKNYSDSLNIPSDTFKRYSRDGTGHSETFANYESEGNVVSGTFSSYAAEATGGSGEFQTYARLVNEPNLKFSSYDAEANGHDRSFSSYSDEANSGDQGFTSYGRGGNGIPVGFASYGRDSNVIGSSFGAYSEQANGANDTFTSYGFNGNVPVNSFRSYGDGGNHGTDSFTSYRETANVGDDSFLSYGKNSNSAKLSFGNYGKSFNLGTDTFKGYGEGAVGQSIGFKVYGENTTFKDYTKKGVTFAQYTNQSTLSGDGKTVSGSGISTNRWVEPGKFFRESMLKPGTVMPMPDIKDKMPPRAFLPRAISAKLPFSLNRLDELQAIFGGENSSMAMILERTLKECDRAPSKGETKKCVASIEDMIDFAVSVLGRDLTVRSTENVAGSKGDILIGNVVGFHGGRPTESVSCHQSLFPYMVYFCHSVPKVRVYEAEILDVKQREKINKGVAICHLDTSSWSEGHGAFVALKGKPGQIEVCHWIFENDMTWVSVH